MNAKIEYKPPFVAFLDILGYSDLVKEKLARHWRNPLKDQKMFIRSEKNEE
jgi:hypothetical protein